MGTSAPKTSSLITRTVYSYCMKRRLAVVMSSVCEPPVTSYGGSCTAADASRPRSITALVASVSSAEQVSTTENGWPTRTALVLVRHQHVTGSTSTFCVAGGCGSAVEASST